MSMLKTTMQDAAGPLTRFAERLGGAYPFQNLAIRYGQTSVSVRFPPVRPQNFRELLAAEFVADGWTYTVIFDSRGIRHGSAVGLKFSHPITVSRDGTQAQGRPKSIKVEVHLPDSTVPLTPQIHDRLVSDAAREVSDKVYAVAHREDWDAAVRRDSIKRRHHHGLALTDPANFQFAEPLKPLAAELWNESTEVDGTECP